MSPLRALALALILTPAAAIAQVPAVVADLPVAQSLAAQVMGDLGTPELLLNRGADPHHYQLRPSQARTLARADLVVWTSAALSPWMADAVDSLAQGEVVQLAQVAGTHHQDFPPDRLTGTQEPGPDPHLWLDPDNAAVWLSALAQSLSRLDPQHAATYAANAARARQDLAALTARLHTILAPARQVPLAMYHDAYGYFATAFGLDIVGWITPGDAATPGAARLATIRQALIRDHVVCLFPEVNHPDTYLSILVQNGTPRIGAPLDPAGVMEQPGPDLYANTLRDLAQSIAACVSSGQ